MIQQTAERVADLHAWWNRQGLTLDDVPATIPDTTGLVFWFDKERGPCIIVTELTGAGLQRAADMAKVCGALVVPVPGQTYRVVETINWPDGVSCECPKRMVVRPGDIQIEWWTREEYERCVLTPEIMKQRYPRLHGGAIVQDKVSWPE